MRPGRLGLGPGPRYVGSARFGPACSACSAAWARASATRTRASSMARAATRSRCACCTTSRARSASLRDDDRARARSCWNLSLGVTSWLAGSTPLACSIEIRLVNACRSCAISRSRLTSSARRTDQLGGEGGKRAERHQLLPTKPRLVAWTSSVPTGRPSDCTGTLSTPRTSSWSITAATRSHRHAVHESPQHGSVLDIAGQGPGGRPRPGAAERWEPGAPERRGSAWSRSRGSGSRLMLNTGGRARQRQRVLVGGGAHTQTASGRSDNGADERRDQSAGAAVGRAARLVTPERHRPMVRQQHYRQVGAGKRHGIPFPPLLRSALFVHTAASARPGPAPRRRVPAPTAHPKRRTVRRTESRRRRIGRSPGIRRRLPSRVFLGRPAGEGVPHREERTLRSRHGGRQPATATTTTPMFLCPQRFLPSVHLLPRNDDHAGASAPRSEASTRQWDEPTDSPVGWSS